MLGGSDPLKPSSEVACLFPKMDYRYILIIVSVLTSVSSSFGSQAITTSSGKTTTLQCPIANLVSDLQSLYWRKDGTTIYSLTGSGVHTIGKYLVTLTASLVIPDVTESDAGNYSCKVVRQSLATEESDVMQLYVIDVSVSHCKGTRQEVGGCSCSINGSNITSLQCSASGFPHPPVITWEEDSIIYQSSSVNLTRFRVNTTLICKARDENVESAVENKTVCVYYAFEVTSSCGSQVETTTASVNNRGAAIVLYIFLIIVLLTLLILCFAAVYLRKAGRVFRLPYTLKKTSTSKVSSVGNLPTSQPESTPVKDEFEDGDCNQDVSKVSSVGNLPTSQPESTPVKDEFEDGDCNQDVIV
ncbi:uncharacterized protein LOC105442583 [Strongylocentrotus purpuratus]|uniref:Ig-like domain-containing protein n=1 Tax=Strongylocentrotus purpuratus TaxID=7668 RepID=A0A7M7P8Z9_STRPU|nr:uncharacterized protein LOC105442583 [Strongylocentrotus purpuratus]